MGIIVSIPRIEGQVTVLPATFSTSYAVDPTQTNAIGVSTRVFGQSSTNTPLLVTVPAAQTDETPPAGDIALSAHDPTSSGLTDTSTTYLSTTTVTRRINSTRLETETATVVASNCPTTPVAASLTVRSPASTRGYSTVEAPRYSDPPAMTSSPYGAPSHNGRSRIEAVSSRRALSILVTRSNKSLSSVAISKSRAFTWGSATTGVSSKRPSDLLPTNNGFPVDNMQTTLTRVGSVSHFDRESLTVRGSGADHGESESTLSYSDLSVPMGHIVSMTGTEKTSTFSYSNDLEPTTTMTKVKDVTTTTMYKSAVTDHTQTTTITKLPISCLSGRKSSSSPAPSSTPCTSATPNPDPPANVTCAEDGLLEYSSSLKPPTTLEGCAVACLADTSCLSFTFTPSERTCYTSLYPLADSAFAGVQPYHIYNYDRDCYSCAS